MYLNTISPAKGSNKDRKRVGRGIGCTSGKTCGRGHKGQHARAGGFHKTGFEGGQMPLQRRLPKVGFKSSKRKLTCEIRLGEINSLLLEFIDMNILKSLNIVSSTCTKVKIIDSGHLDKSIIFKGCSVTEGANKKILLAGGKVEV